MATETQTAFAARRGVNRGTVSKWKDKGLLVLTADGLVDVEATEWNLDQRPATYRGGTTHRPVRAIPKDEPDPRERPKAAKAKPKPEPARPSDGAVDPDDGDPDDPDSPNLPLAQAVERKENYLGLRRKQEFQKAQGELVDRPAAEALFFETARALRDAWIAWPARVAIGAADEIRIDPETGKVDPRSLTMVLTAHVQQHLAELGEPDLELSRH